MSSSFARQDAVWLASTRRRAASPMPRRSSSGMSVNTQRISRALSPIRISEPWRKNSLNPGHTSLITGTPQAAASNRRTLGDHPAATMSLRVMLSVKRWEL